MTGIGEITYIGEVDITVKNDKNESVRKFTTHNAGTIKLFRALVCYLAGTPEPNSVPRFIDLVSTASISCLKHKAPIGAIQTMKLTSDPTLYLRTAISADLIKIFDGIDEIRMFSQSTDGVNDYLANIEITDDVKASIATAQGMNYTFVIEWKLKFANN